GPAEPVEVVTSIVAATGTEDRPEPRVNVPDRGSSIIGAATVHVSGTGREVEIHARELLPHGRTIRGPALVTQDDATTWIAEDWSPNADSSGNLLIGRRT